MYIGNDTKGWDRMIGYHGSTSLFEVFDYDKIGTNGTSEGIGFYFTNNKNVAMGYGQQGFIYTVDIHYQKPLSSEKKTITKTQLKKYLSILHQETEYLSNWGDIEYEGFVNVLNRAVESEFNHSENDVELISGISHASGNIEVGLTTLYKVLGYDSIVMEADWGNQQLYIALTNDIITIVDVQALKVA
jgi:hypothetical protein